MKAEDKGAGGAPGEQVGAPVLPEAARRGPEEQVMACGHRQAAGRPPCPPWRFLDDRARRRRILRVLAAAAAVVAMLAGFSALPTSAAHPGRSRDHGTSERYGDVIPDGSPTTVRADAAGE